MADEAPAAHHGRMILAGASSGGFLAATAQSRPKLAGLMGAVLLGIAVALGSLTLATPFIRSLMSRAPLVPEHLAIVLASMFALLAPGVFLVLGLSGLLQAGSAMRRDRSLQAIDAATAGRPGMAVLGPIRIGAATLPRVLVGGHGVTLLWPLADSSRLRHDGGRWLARASRGAWVPIPDPIEAAAREADAIAEHLRRSVPGVAVPVTAVAVGRPSSPLSDACPTLDPERFATWMAGLAGRAELTPATVRRVVELLEDA